MDSRKKIMILEVFLALLSFCYLLSGITIMETDRRDCGAGIWGFGIASWLAMFFTFLGYLAYRWINYINVDMNIHIHEYISETRGVVWSVSTILVVLCLWGSIVTASDDCYFGTMVSNWSIISLMAEYLFMFSFGFYYRKRYCGAHDLPIYEPRTDWTNRTAPPTYSATT